MELMELLAARRTYRRFEQKEIPAAVVEEILQAARLASSAANRQPLGYVVVRGQDKVNEVFKLTKWAAYLPPEQGQPKDQEKPALFVAVIENLNISKDCGTDAGLAIGNMTLAAWNRGVGSCIIGACNKPQLSQMFGLSPCQKLHTVVAFGYPSHTSRTVDIGPDGDVKYYLDEKRDYVVPKRKLEDIVVYYE